MNHPNINTSGLLIPARRGTLRCYSSVLLAALLASLATAQAQLWSFNLIGGPTAINNTSDEPQDPEILHMTGSGRFDTLTGTASGGGAFVITNAEEEDLPPTLRGVWVVTGLDSFDSAGGLNPGLQGGSLIVNITLIFNFGFELPGTLTVYCPFDGVAFDEANDGIEVFVDGAGRTGEGETFTTPPGGAPHSTVFHKVKP